MIDFIIVAGAVIICGIVIIYRIKNKSCGCGGCGKCRRGNCAQKPFPPQLQTEDKISDSEEDRH
ncbi:MAG: hypothetical protein J6N52_01110 [Clostridia bacterium]|nr:hypothetical protein [Clostridia bacterium]